MEADDLALPYRSAIQSDFMENNSEITERPDKIWIPSLTDESIKVIMLFKYSFYHPTIFYRKTEIFNEHGGYDTQFSDDLTWTQQNLDFIKHRTFVEFERNIPDHEEMWLMSQCQNNIIANSTFSWWGARLNKNHKKIVITPQGWFKDSTKNTSYLIPKSWLRL